jgi:hypothetical protein
MIVNQSKDKSNYLIRRLFDMPDNFVAKFEVLENEPGTI